MEIEHNIYKAYRVHQKCIHSQQYINKNNPLTPPQRNKYREVSLREKQCSLQKYVKNEEICHMFSTKLTQQCKNHQLET
jgi:hypothetical protein